MVFDICLVGVEMVGSLCCSTSSERSQQGRVLPDVSTAYRKHVVLELGNRSVILEVYSPVGVAIHQACNGVRSVLHMYAVTTDFQVIVLGGSLPRHTPVGRHTPNIVGKPRACIGLHASNMF